MSAEFCAEPEPSPALFEELAAASPANPFCSAAFAEARRSQGERPWVLSLRDNAGGLIAGCAAFGRSGRLSRSLEVPSLPSVGDDRVFWDGLLELCGRLDITQLRLDSFASPPGRIPSLPGEVERVRRIEYIIPLRGADLWKPLRKGHRWTVNRGRKAGLVVRRSTAAADCRVHCSLMGASMERRAERGENVPTGDAASGPLLALLQAGAGELFQATFNDMVVSSALILTSRSGGYFQTAGTSPEGMARGASQFLVFEIARSLQEHGMEAFNLGGVAGSNPGLHEFKIGFGAEPVALEAASCQPARGLRGMLVAAVGEVRKRWTIGAPKT